MQNGHGAALDLVDPGLATHIAANNGSWFDPATWAGGAVPGAGARVHIPAGVTVSYDGQSPASLFTVRTDGNLSFATDTDTSMRVDTLVVAHGGKLTIGTAADPVAQGVASDIIFVNNGAIDTNWDPTLVSRGLIALGEVEIHGQEKDAHLKVSTDPMAGDNALTFDETPQGWQVGDKIVIAGTSYDGYRWDNSIRAVRHYPSEDEVRTITGISGNIVTLDQPLSNDHDAPRADLKTSVANYTRNITLSSEDPASAAVHERGHVMFHSHQTDIRYAAFEELGRTDKSQPAREASEFSSIASDSNVKGRYPIHFHRNGVDSPEDAAVAIGNAIFGSPGWGVTHHDSNAIISGNATFNTFGAGYVAETGNEIGVWSDNIAIHAKGTSKAAPKNGVDLANFDTAKTGDGFWFQGRLVSAEDNIAASVNRGFVYFHRGNSTDDGSVPGNINLDAAQFELPEALGGRSSVGIDDAPIRGFVGNEAFASHEGLHVVKANPNQGHDIHSELVDFTAWNVANGAHLEYTSHYILRDFDLVALEDRAFVESFDGISFGQNVSDMVVVGVSAEGFNQSGVNLFKRFTDAGLSLDRKQLVVVDANLTNNGTDILNYDARYDRVIDSASLTQTPLSISFDGPLTYKEGYPDPTARKVTVTGTKTDSLGAIRFPAGTDNYDAGMREVIGILETEGWFSTASGERVFFLEDYYSDRLTGEIFKFSVPVFIDPNVPLGNQYFSYRDAVYRGEVDLSNGAPLTRNEDVTLAQDSPAVIDLLANDSDPEGNAPSLDGFVRPHHGQIIDNGDGTITYRPFKGFTGQDSAKYWVNDGAGNVTEAWLTLDVVADIVISDPIQGTALSDTLTGTAGDDTILGLGGNDRINGGAGDDVIDAGSGNDWNVFGGSGADIFRFGAGSGKIRVRDYETGTDRIELVGITTADIQIVANARNNTVNIYSDTGDRLILKTSAPLEFGPDDIL